MWVTDPALVSCWGCRVLGVTVGPAWQAGQVSSCRFPCGSCRGLQRALGSLLPLPWSKVSSVDDLLAALEAGYPRHSVWQQHWPSLTFSPPAAASCAIPALQLCQPRGLCSCTWEWSWEHSYFKKTQNSQKKTTTTTKKPHHTHTKEEFSSGLVLIQIRSLVQWTTWHIINISRTGEHIDAGAGREQKINTINQYYHSRFHPKTPQLILHFQWSTVNFVLKLYYF